MISLKRFGYKINIVPALAVLTLVLLAPIAARAQWAAPTPGSTDITNTNTTGNVGVGTGTSAPAGKLDVKGSTSDTSAAALTVRNSTDTNLFFIRNDGRVGMGATSPLAFFHVARADATTGAVAFFQKDTSSNGVILGTNNSKAFLSGVNSNLTAMTDLLLNPFGGNIGIGTLTPSARLHVQGGNVFHQYSTTTGQEYGFYTALNTNHVTSNLAFDGQWKMIGAGKGALAYVGTGGGVAFGVSADNTSRAAGGVASPTQHFTVTMDGNVGVGVIAPTFKLDVAGQVRSSSGGFVFPDNTTQTTALAFGSTAGKAVQGNTTLTVTAGTGMSGGGAVTLGSGGTITLNNSDTGSSQNIFKNVANAAGVTQFSATSNNDTISFEGTGGTTVSFVGKKVTINSSASGQWSTLGSTVYYNGGNVGIGTSTPLSGLTGNGGMELYVPSAVATLRVGTGLAGKNNAQVRFSGASGDNWAIGSDVATHSGTRDFHFYDFAGTPGARLTVQSSTGNVGIGTLTPGGQLSVTGASAAGGSVEAHILNSTASGYQALRLGTDSVAGSSLWLNAFNASWTTAGWSVADSGGVYGTGSGGLTIGAGHTSGVVRFYTGGSNPVNERMRIDASGNVGIGTASPGASYKLDVNGQAHVSGDMTVDGNIAAKYQDVAEWVPSSQKLSAGTVVVLDAERTNHVSASAKAYDTSVAGVVSDTPGVILGQGGDGKLKVATTGRVKVKVDATRAPIHVGDLLVTSDVEGLAMKSIPVDLGGTQIHRPGTIVGKALESLESGMGEILVLLSLQ